MYFNYYNCKEPFTGDMYTEGNYNKVMCIKDSLCSNNQIYTLYHSNFFPDAWFRNEGDSVVYTRYQDGDSIYINMNWKVDLSYIQWVGQKSKIITVLMNDTINYNGTLRKRMKYIYVGWRGSYLEEFVQGLGILNQYYSGQSYVGWGFYNIIFERASLNGYLFYDSTGNYTYIYAGGKPSLKTTFSDDYTNKVLNINAYIEHIYDHYYYKNDDLLYYDTFIDSVWVEYFYQKDDQKTNTLTFRLLNNQYDRNFKGIINPDISLLNLGYTLKCRVAAVDKAIIPNYVYSEYYSSKLVGIEDNDKIVYSYKLNNNYPNPFNPSTTISFEIPNDDKVTLTVYDVLGNKVKTLVDEYRTRGKYYVQFNAENLSSGIYFYLIRYRGKQLTGKMNLVK